jgi:hypothetical protein
VPVSGEVGQDALARGVAARTWAGASAICAPKMRVVVVVIARPPCSTMSTRQPEHGGGLPASADHRHDVVTRQAERLRQLHRHRVPGGSENPTAVAR